MDKTLGGYIWVIILVLCNSPEYICLFFVVAKKNREGFPNESNHFEETKHTFVAFVVATYSSFAL